jgi:hypothetical protein
MSNFKLYQGYQELSCGSVVVFDGLANGNLKDDNSSFFAGVKTIAYELKLFEERLNQVYKNLSKISSNSSEINSTLNLAIDGKTKVSQIPNADSSSLVLNYKTPFR